MTSAANGGGRTVSVLVRGTSQAVVAEAARSLHDALCAVRCVARRPALLPGGGAPEVRTRLLTYCYSAKDSKHLVKRKPYKKNV